jgi:tRNA G18 (ribose-2'-O)-methylase SpoU
LIAACRLAGIIIAATAADAPLVYSDYHWQQPTLIIFGNEARGMGASLFAHCHVQLRIPMRGAVESLNVAASAAAVLFEAARQRRK